MEIPIGRFAVRPLNAHYEGSYSEREIQWRAVCARDKAANIAAMLGPRAESVRSVAEVGCGTGAVLIDVKRRGVGSEHLGVDVADPDTHPDPAAADAGIVMTEYDGKRLPFDDAHFDLVYASHVLEHVPDPRGFLQELARVARQWIYVEVPCEIHWRASVNVLQRTLDIGHINAYTPETFLLTLQTAGLDVVDLQIFDHSIEAHSFGGSRAVGRVKAAIRRAALRLGPTTASRLWTYHVGALCRAPATAKAG